MDKGTMKGHGLLSSNAISHITKREDGVRSCNITISGDITLN